MKAHLLDLQNIITAVVGVLLAISELLARLKGVKANSISELILPRKDKPTEEVTKNEKPPEPPAAA